LERAEARRPGQAARNIFVSKGLIFSNRYYKAGRKSMHLAPHSMRVLSIVHFSAFFSAQEFRAAPVSYFSLVDKKS
jgi:hypothetical protein